MKYILIILIIILLTGCKARPIPPQPKFHTLCNVQILTLVPFSLAGMTDGKLVTFQVNWIVWNTLNSGVTVNLNYDESGIVQSISYVNPCVIS